MTTDEVLQTPFCQVPMGEFLRLYKSQGPMNVPVEMVPFGKYMELERTISITTGWGNALIMSVVSVVLVQWWQRRTKRKAEPPKVEAVWIPDQCEGMCLNVLQGSHFACTAVKGHAGFHNHVTPDLQLVCEWPGDGPPFEATLT